MNCKSLLLLTSLCSVAAFGENPPLALAIPVPSSMPRTGIQEPTLSCPKGTRQAGGQNTTKEAAFCVGIDAAGRQLMHGPYLSLHRNATPAVRGQYADGMRTGLWTTFDEGGAKVEEVTFVGDLYQGLRTQWISGRKVIEETYVAGRRQGPQKTWDASGKLTVVQFVNDEPLRN